MSLKSTVNEERLFSKLSSFFDRPDTVLIELAQNAQRSGATAFDVKMDGDTLVAVDNGRGCSDPESLFVLASSGWSKEVEQQQDPAGWGIMFLAVISETITYRSVFGSITFDCQEYLHSAAYRRAILSRVDLSDTCEGFFVSASLRPTFAEKILNNLRCLRFFPLDITINSEHVQRSSIASEMIEGRCDSWDVLRLSYEGNDLYVRVTSHLADNLQGFEAGVGLVWYGIPIHVYNHSKVYLDVVTGMPLTPVLPIRKAIKEDDKLAALHKFVVAALVKHSIAFINDPAQTNLCDLDTRMAIVSQFGTQAELDSLNRFMVSFEEPHYDHGNVLRRSVIIAQGEPVPVSECVRSVSIGQREVGRDHLDWGLVLPPATIVGVSSRERRPSWLVIPEKACDIVVTPLVNHETGRLTYDWTHASISCEGKDIPCLAVMNGWGDGQFFYGKTPHDVYDIVEAVFTRHIRSDDIDSDRWETQSEEFSQEIDHDICLITGKYNKSDLLAGFRAAGIKIEDILGMKVTRKALALQLRGGKTIKIGLAV